MMKALAPDIRLDAELLRQAKEGNPRAMQELYQRHSGAVFSRLTHLVGATAEREDLLQETFLALFQQLHRFREEASLSTYVQRIATNKAYDHLRKQTRLRSNEVNTERDAPGLEPGPEAKALGSERSELLRSCMDQLKPKKRIAFILRVVEGLSLSEISAQVDASVPAVAQRIRHARMELTEMVRLYEEKEDGR